MAKKKRATKVAKKARRKANFKRRDSFRRMMKDRKEKDIAAFFAPEISRGLKLLAAETDTTVQALMAEALSDLFAKRGKYQLAQALQPAETAEGHTDLSTGITDKD